MTQEQLKTFFDKEVETIRRNPHLGGDWGTLQEYLQWNVSGEGWTSDRGTSQVFHTDHSFGSNPRTCVATYIFAKNRVAYIKMEMPKLECVREPPSRYKEHELDTLELPMPNDLQRLLMIKRFRKR